MPNDDPRPEDKPKLEFLPEPYPMTPEEKAAILAKYKSMYTQEEMERMCIEALEDIEKGNYVDGDQLLTELEAIHQRVTSGKRE